FFSRSWVEVNENVAAEYRVDPAHDGHPLGVHQVQVAKVAYLPQAVVHVASIHLVGEIGAFEVGADHPKRRGAVDAAESGGHATSRNVAAEYANVPALER